MKKLFTILAAALFATSMFAATEQICFATLESIDKNNNETGIPQQGCTMAWSKITSDKDFVEIDGHKYYKFSGDDSYVRLILNNGDKFQAGDVVSITVAANQSKKVSVAFSSGNKTTEAQVSNTEAGVVTRELVAADIESDGSIKMSRGGNSNMRVCSFSVERDATTEPVLNVNPKEVTFELTAAKMSDVANVTFTGKNLTPGEYSLIVPNLAGFEISPIFVTVGEDGKLSQEVTISYSSDVDVEQGSTIVSLFIGPDQVEATVNINFSASFEKNYLSQSVNIEQWVLDNGKDNEAFLAVLETANIEFSDINELDSLNDEKDLRNEPYLGLKLKKQGARIACWLQAGDRIAVKFGMRKDAVIIGVNGEYNELEAGEAATSIDRTAEQDEYLEIIAKTDGKTIVLKQIMLNEDIADVVLPGEETAVENTAAATKATKRIISGQVIIEKNGATYNVLGAEVK
jgi:hypothetical protein